MPSLRQLVPLVAVCGLVHAADTATPGTGATSEKTFLDDLPVVLSVSRLAQPLDETPGAVTVIDRDMIRRSGAREVAEVLRLVPGFVMTRWNGGNPVAMYHAAMDSYGRTMQVFIDGRSVYSSFQFGDTHWGLTGLVLEDIERIEVLRGSNSAAMGANAYLGVVNIITRHATDTRGAMVSITRGTGNVSDQVARIGWGDDNAAFRLTLASRGDSGFDGIHDNNRVTQANFRGDLKPTGRDEIAIHAGIKENSYGEGNAGDVGNPQRYSQVGNAYANGSWLRQLDDGNEIRVTASHEFEKIVNSFPYPDVTAGTARISGIYLDFSGTAHRTKIEGQHTLRLGDGLRGVWGGGYTREAVTSLPLYNVDDSVSAHTWRLFGNIEWRPWSRLVVNAGTLLEHHSILGLRNAPRLMFNYHLAPGHTLRLGGSRAYRTPTLFELRGDARYYGNANADAVLLGYSPRSFLYNPFRARGNVTPETMSSTEIGYLGEIRPLNLGVDVRVFDENNLSIVRANGYAKYGALNRTTNDFINYEGPRIRGWETQLRWQPSADTKLLFNYAETKLFPRSDRISSEAYAAPTHAATLALFQRLPEDFDLGVIYTTSGEMSWSSWNKRLPSTTQTDVRLAKGFRYGGTKGEFAVTVQALGGNQRQYEVDATARPMFFDRRAFATLKLEF